MKRHTIEQQARKSEKMILKNNRDWINNFIEENYANNSKYQIKQKNQNGKLKTIWISFGSSITTIAIIITLVLIWPLIFPIPESQVPQKHYLLENEAFYVSDIAELNTDLHEFVLMLEEGYNKDIRLIYDSLSNDKLYYKLEVSNQETYETIIILIYINPNYENRGELANTNSNETASVGNFSIIYNSWTVDEDWAFFLTCHAVANYNDIIIYIEYEQLSLYEENNFLHFFEKTFVGI